MKFVDLLRAAPARIVTVRAKTRMLRRDKKGAAALEYVLIAAVMSVAVVAAGAKFGGNLMGLYSGLGATAPTVNCASSAAGTGSCTPS